MTQNSNQDDTQPGDGLPEMLHVPSLWVRVATFSLRSFYVFVAGVWMYVAYVVLFPGWPSSIGELIEAAQRKPVTPVPVHAPSLAEQAAARQRELVRAAAEAAAMASEKETQRRRDEHWERRKEIIERFTGVHVSAIDGRRAVLWVTNCRECAHSAASHPVWPKFELYIEPTKEILPTFAYLRALDTDDNFTQFGLCSSNWHNADNTEKAAGPPPCKIV